MKPRSLIHPRDEIAQMMERIYHYRMTTTSGGNLSILDENGDLWITPAGVDKGTLRREDIVCIRANGQVEGLHRPSSEHPFHQAIYRCRPDLRAVVHAHPTALVTFSICRHVPDTTLFPQAKHVCGTVGYAPYALPGSQQLGANIAKVFAQGFQCVLLENHGVVVGGTDLSQAFKRFETLEFTAKTLIKGRLLGEIQTLGSPQLAQAQTRRDTLEEFHPPVATTLEKELRQQLSDFVRRGYRQRLMTSTKGSFSARLGDDSFLITPYGADRGEMERDDLVWIHEGKREAGKQPSRAYPLHRAIYRRHPNVRAVVNAIPVNATAFGVTGTVLDSRTIPESYLVLHDAVRIPYGIQYGEGDTLAALLSLDRPVGIVENDGVMVLGKNVLDAFDRLEVLEATAEAVINAKAIGTVQPMDANAIAELERAFWGKNE